MESLDIDMWNCSSESQMKLMNMMLQLEELTGLSDQLPQLSNHFSTSSPPAYCIVDPTSLSLPALLDGPRTPISFNTGTALQEAGLTFVNPTPISATNLSAALCGSSLLSHDAAAMREDMCRMASMQPVQIDPEYAKPPRRRNVKTSTDPHSVAARHRRWRISERMRVLQQMVPGGTKMDTASMLDEAIHYVNFLKSQVQTLELVVAGVPQLVSGFMSGAGDHYYSDTYGQIQDQAAVLNSGYVWNK